MGFTALVRDAIVQNTCLNPSCTTCGSDVFRHSLRALGPRLQIILSEMSIEELVSIERWSGALRIAYRELSFDQQRALLTIWLARPELPTRFVNVVIFYFVRYLLLSPELREEWIRRAIGLSVATRDHSLTESLVWVLGRKCDSFHNFLEVAQALRRSNGMIDRALRENGYA